MQQITLALDWTPNINHIGFFVALEKGLYKHAGLEVQITNPQEDDYATTPAKKVEQGKADFALCPMESIISYRTKAIPFDLVATAAILQQDLSAIVVLETSNINSPRQLDGKTYASYGARYEDKIVQQMVVNDGGKGHISLLYPKKLGIWNTLLQGMCDATWIFINWEGVIAKAQNQPLRYFKMSDYQIPYAYSLVLAASAKKVKSKAAIYHKFMVASKQGFLFSQTNAIEAISILAKYVPSYDQHINLHTALSLTAKAFGTNTNWGNMQAANVKAFIDWLYLHKLEAHPLPLECIFTNELLD